jgi:Amt family ammonium transporter
LFASKAINSAGNDGLFFGNPGQFVTQLVAVATTWIFVGVATFIILKVVDMVVGLRVTGDEERTGLDLSQHHESGYSL